MQVFLEVGMIEALVAVDVTLFFHMTLNVERIHHPSETSVESTGRVSFSPDTFAVGVYVAG